jgi:hypothetical protein
MLRTAITASITRSGVPPQNPYFAPGQAFPLRYHYFWFLPASLVDQLGGSLVSARQALIGGTIWCGIGLIAVLPLYLRFFQPKGAANLEKRTLTAIALLSVTGLDLVPVALLGILANGLFESIEWWNGPVMAWTHAVLWVPHHVAALVASLTGFLVVYFTFDGKSVARRGAAAAAGGMMFASSVGLSIYVTFVFAAALAVLAGILVWKRRWSQAATLVLAGVIALVLAFPYLADLSGRSPTGPPAVGNSATTVNTVASGDATAGPLFELAVRPFTIAETIVRANWPNRPSLVPVVDLLLLPMNYFLEFGLFGVVGVAMFMRLRRKEPLQLSTISAYTIAATSLLICTFVRSSVITNNDLGWRGMLVAQFILLIWAAELWDEGFFSAQPRKWLVATCLMLGVCGTAYEITMIRFYTLVSDSFDGPRDSWFPSDHHLGERTYAMRSLYEQLHRNLPLHATVQHNPNQPLGDVFHGLYADRQLAVETPVCGVVFGGDRQVCDRVMPSLSKIFTDAGSELHDVESACEEFSITAVIVKDTDPVWKNPESWVWKRQPLVANPHARALPCTKD